MKTLTLSKGTLILAAAAAFLFTGCNVDGSQVVNQAVSPETTSAQPSQSATPATPTTPAAQTPAPDTSATPAVTEPTSKVSEALQQEYLDLINAARAETQDCGTMGVFDPAPALSWNTRLDNAAYEHSNDMAQSNTFSHTGSGTATDTTAQDQALGRGSKFSERVRNNGYTQYRKAGENIAAGYATAQETVDAWLESDHHCANLMDPAFSEVGMALVEKDDSDYGFYWSQEFGGK